MSHRWHKVLDTCDRTARVLENALIGLLLSMLIVLGSSQIFMRNVLSRSLPWGDEFVRLLVLWLALAGAVAASRDGRQIRIDILSRLLPGRLVWIPDCIANAFTAAVCALLAWHSARFVADSYTYGDMLLGDRPAWLLQLVLPVGFAVMGYRYTMRTLKSLPQWQ